MQKTTRKVAPDGGFGWVACFGVSLVNVSIRCLVEKKKKIFCCQKFYPQRIPHTWNNEEANSTSDKFKLYRFGTSLFTINANDFAICGQHVGLFCEIQAKLTFWISQATALQTTGIDGQNYPSVWFHRFRFTFRSKHKHKIKRKIWRLQSSVYLLK